jgi:hypothetical protein
MYVISRNRGLAPWMPVLCNLGWLVLRCNVLVRRACCSCSQLSPCTPGPQPQARLAHTLCGTPKHLASLDDWRTAHLLWCSPGVLCTAARLTAGPLQRCPAMMTLPGHDPAAAECADLSTTAATFQPTPSLPLDTTPAAMQHHASPYIMRSQRDTSTK